ncbi:YgaP-like transmembrane domain [Solibacillus sp. CAU 1738]|uniref:YgaP-like transmembrane domain n=1 Tax=Solibacillus sp. CAU 1738 TaxID=3140363 RepID=UPI003260CE0A
MLNENISERNAFIRLICGVSMTSCGIGRIARNPSCMIGHGMIVLGAMKIAEGTFLYCPLKAMLGAEEEV